MGVSLPPCSAHGAWSKTGALEGLGRLPEPASRNQMHSLNLSSCATETLETVARPRWLSGDKEGVAGALQLRDLLPHEAHVGGSRRLDLANDRKTCRDPLAFPPATFLLPPPTCRLHG